VRHYLIALALLAIATTAAAQEPGRVYKMGWLTMGRPGLVIPPFEKWSENGANLRDGLKDSGFIAGRNLTVETRHGSGDPSRLASEAAAFVASGVDVLGTLGTPPTAAAIQVTRTTPIVFVGVGDPVEKGLIASLAKPGANVTGMSVLIAGPKLWQNLREVAPGIARAGYISNARNVPAADRAADFVNMVQARMVANATAAGLQPLYMRVQSLDDIEARFKELAAAGSAGALISQDEMLVGLRKEILALALHYRIPTTCGGARAWVEAGCLVTYLEDNEAIWRGAGLKIAKVLKGIRPADIPVEQPTTYKVVINLKTAKAIGLEVPPMVVAKADEVIE
jgi:putative ABC transport system substrate-binding protein